MDTIWIRLEKTLYPDFIQIFQNLTQSKFYPDFIWIKLGRIEVKFLDFSTFNIRRSAKHRKVISVLDSLLLRL